MEMRKVLCDTMTELMSQNDNIVFMDADLAEANGTMPLRKMFPERAFDTGISEQNMASMAAGMSAYGMNPYICTFTAFSTRRICDQIAISMSYAKQNIKIIGTDAGIASELNGGTHMSFEDIGVLRSIPGVTIIDVCDEVELRKVLIETVNYEGVVYIRMPRKQVPKVYKEDNNFELLRGNVLREGTDVTIFTTGIMTSKALEAHELLKKEGISAEVVALHTIKPIDKDIVIKSLKKTKRAVTCENHNIIGGLYSSICEISCSEVPSVIKAIGINDHFGEVGSMKFLSKKYGMDSEDIVKKCKEVINF
ncbi:transketolase C-terminal domain-containing protein [Clostridium baratii]|uniref:transketolase family protein n=1 Tax=Clostridium baratii TaxID=1561 RepID=UPI002912EEA6|nr:transketolase C-terminal domain-containing protein [Clostridium baratii]MDU4912082.1 transketolase C-terminal domain-containing protein [Clostridium baratii]